VGVVSYLDPAHKGRGSISTGVFPIVSPRIQACVTKASVFVGGVWTGDKVGKGVTTVMPSQRRHMSQSNY